jgi:hypothetical protein
MPNDRRTHVRRVDAGKNAKDAPVAKSTDNDWWSWATPLVASKRTGRRNEDWLQHCS